MPSRRRARARRSALLALASTAMRIARNGSRCFVVLPLTARRIGHASATTIAATPTSVTASDTGGTIAEPPPLTSARSPRYPTRVRRPAVNATTRRRCVRFIGAPPRRGAAARSSATRPRPGSTASGSTSSHGCSTNARCHARGCGSSSRSSASACPPKSMRSRSSVRSPHARRGRGRARASIAWSTSRSACGSSSVSTTTTPLR